MGARVVDVAVVQPPLSPSLRLWSCCPTPATVVVVLPLLPPLPLWCPLTALVVVGGAAVATVVWVGVIHCHRSRHWWWLVVPLLLSLLLSPLWWVGAPPTAVTAWYPHRRRCRHWWWWVPPLPSPPSFVVVAAAVAIVVGGRWLVIKGRRGATYHCMSSGTCEVGEG